MRYLVTGGSGFIGRHLTQALMERGDSVLVLDTALPVLSWPLPAEYEYRQVNVTDFSGVKAAMAGCDGVFHLAAVVGFANVMADPIRTILTNTAGTDVVLQCAADLGIPVLLTSTSAVYGRSTNGGQPVTEEVDGLLGPTSTTSWSYAYAKACDEALAFAYHRYRDLPVVVARLFNTVGPYQSAEAGFVLPRFVRAALAGEPLQVHRPGTQTRTFVHVRDVVRVLVALFEHPEARGQVVNVGGTATVSIANLAHLVIGVLSSTSSIQTVSQPYGQGYDNVSERKPDLTRLQALLGWLPNTPIEVMIRDTAEALCASAAAS
jgi:UDP-glucose 4-epimerase